MNCPHCGTANTDQSRFCLRCGKPLMVENNIANPQPIAPETEHRVADNPQVSTQAEPAGSQPVFPGVQEPSYPLPQGPAPTNFPPQAPYQPSYPPPMQQQPYMQQQYMPQPSYGQVGLSMLNIWGPFAGYGTRRRHIGWLMDGKAAHYKMLLQQVNKRLQERQVAGMTSMWQTLTAKGVMVESRPYFLIHKGLVTLGLSIQAIGRDLFISIATYLKPPLSNFRVILLGVSVLFALVGIPIMSGVVGAAASSFNMFGGNNNALGAAMMTVCVIGPLWAINWLALQLALLYSLYKWLTERDFLALLRVAPNEFNEDDLMAMEKAVEQTVRSSLDDIGLNPAELKPASVQGNEQRLI